MNSRGILIFGLACIAAITFSLRRIDDNVVNVYGWYRIISREIFTDFEKETGIKVVYDVYDNNDTLEAKLLATNSGYDVVFPSFIPYASRQSLMGVYTKLDTKLIPNIKNVGGIITEKFANVGGDLNCLIPIFWGTTGIAYDESVIARKFEGEKIDSYAILLDPSKIKLIAKYGVSFPEEFIDIFPQTAAFLKIQSDSKNLADLSRYVDHFKKIRKYIKKFSSSTMINDLISGEVCAAIGASDNAWRARKSAKAIGKNINFITPRDSALIWIDCVAIPSKAPHKGNAHKFINYLLRPEVAAKITNSSGILVNVPDAVQLFNDDITENDQICPRDPEVLGNAIIGKPSKTDSDRQYDKTATRVWSKIRMNDFQYSEVPND